MTSRIMSAQRKEWWAALTPEARKEFNDKRLAAQRASWRNRGWWTEDREARLRELWGTMSVRDICMDMGFAETAQPTHGSVIGKAHRMGLPPYPRELRYIAPQEPKLRVRGPAKPKLIDPWRGR